jgi:hypothetical protein
VDLKAIIELLGKEHGAADEMTGAFLDDAVASFSSKPAAATNAIRQLQASDPSGFALAAVRLLAAKTEKSPGVQYVAGLLFAGNLLIDPLLDEDAMPLDAAVSLARNLASAEPILDARLLHKLLANAGGEVRGIKTSAALRALRLVEAISGCARISSYLIQLLRHPSPEVQSKVALLIGRANLNLTRVKKFLSSEDDRLRANTVESLWGHQSSAVREVLRDAVKDSSARASMNALTELCRLGDPEACERITYAATSHDPVERSRGAWAMGECGNPEFAAPLEKLGADPDARVRGMAQKSRAKLRKPEPEKPPVIDEEARGVENTAPAHEKVQEKLLTPSVSSA